VAIKVLRTGLGMPARGAERLGREARALARLSHPNVVAVHDVGEDRGHVFVAMELVRGCTLRDWHRTTARSWEEILDVFLQAGRGLAAAHAAGILHRDFKPENVLVGDDGRVRVGDFGLARRVEAQDAEGQPMGGAGVAPSERSLTATGAAVGTPAYMAPEQRRGEETGPACDQFAFAVSLYESLWGTRPYGDADVGRLRPELTHPTRPPAASMVPAWIFPVLETALDLDPRRRHPSMQALLQGLARGLRPAPDGHVRANAIFQILLCAMHTTISGFFLWVVLYKPASDAPGRTPPTIPPQDTSSGVVLALSVWMALLLFSGWLPLGIPWTAVNAVGLWRGRRWALWSTLIYAFVAIPTCLGTPYAVYAIFSLWSRARKKKRDLDSLAAS
jgi:serine/threonine protein kinase